jgi:osmoprotectant transport system ATP-binding protein
VTHDIDEAIKMGDFVAVMQVGGKLAQFGPPVEILSAPASDFVARFVGADRGLKRLSLSRVGDLELRPAIIGRPGERVADARDRVSGNAEPWLLLLDEEAGPVGWVNPEALPADGVIDERAAVPMSPLLNPRTTLKDALSMLLDADVQTGVVVDERGAVQGVVTVETITERLREGAPGPGPRVAAAHSA